MALPKTTASDVQALLNEVNAAGSTLLGEHADTSPVPLGPARGRLIAAAQKLAAELQNPIEAMLENLWQVWQPNGDNGSRAFNQAVTG
jgi:hypothetical protein